MSVIPGMWTEATAMFRRQNEKDQFHYNQFTHSHGGNPMRILGAESFLDGNTLSIAHSLADLAQQPTNVTRRNEGRVLGGERYSSGTATPPILKARQADIEINRLAERRKLQAAQRKQRSKGSSEEPPELQPSKKKQKKKTKSGEDEDDGHEAEKKTRGRPRLDTKDESAADRRRTQIRMAQRAYRNRKESTITSLESRVEKLQSANDEMQSAFLGLYNLAATKGLLQKDPDFGQQVQSSMHRVLTLARSSTSEESNTQDENSSPPSSAPAVSGNFDGQSRIIEEIPEKVPQQPFSNDGRRRSKPTTTSPWGYDVSYVPADTTYNTERWFEQLVMPPSPKPNRHEVIARATEQNASFPCDMYPMETFPASPQAAYYNFGQNSQNAPSPSAFTPMFSSSPFMQGPVPWTSMNPLAQLSMPMSYSYQEVSFARRLHRSLGERGVQMLMNPARYAGCYEHVFGLTVRLYGKERFLEALRHTLKRGTSEPLSIWDIPFTNVGGAGLHFPPGEQDIMSNMMPNVQTGRTIGPLIKPISESQARYLVDHYRGNLPGYEGEWYDSNDVESYLRTKGLYIPPFAEWVTVDPEKLLEESRVTSLDDLPTNDQLPAGARYCHDDTSWMRSSTSAQAQAAQGVDPTTGCYVGLGNDFARVELASYVQQTGPDWLPHLETNRAPMDDRLNTSTNSVPSSGFEFMNTPFGPMSTMGSSSSSQPQRLITLNVSMLMEAISVKSVCLGRAPGFRRKDIDIALRQMVDAAR